MRRTASFARDEPLLHHLERDPERRRGRPLRRAGLQDVELPLLDRELDVLHVAVVALQRVHRRLELGVRAGQDLFELLERLRRADAGDDVLALRVEEELAVRHLLAGRRIARERDAGRRALTGVAEHHLDDVDGGADRLRNVVQLPVDLCARVLPRAEDRLDGSAQLAPGVLRKWTSERPHVDVLEGLDQITKIVGAEVGVGSGRTCLLQRRQSLLEEMAVDAVDDLTVHLDETAV